MLYKTTKVFNASDLTLIQFLSHGREIQCKDQNILKYLRKFVAILLQVMLNLTEDALC
jgi:hypothetical protein